MAQSLVSPVLVGRQAELESLTGALKRALGGEQATVLVGGEAGLGKSRLVQELIARAREAEARVLFGTCVELGAGGIPFAPVIDMLRELAGELPESELAEVLGAARPEIGRLVPELADGPLEPSGPERDPSTLLELMVGVVGRLAAAAPLMLVFEDLQWADQPTIDLLALLVARSGARRLLLVLTARSDELHRAHPFRRMAARWEQQRFAERLELERLGRREVAAQIEAILAHQPDGDLVEFIAERSEGIPLFVEELLGAVRDGRVEQDFLPPSLRDVVLARVELLSANAQEVLRAVSAAARTVPDRLLATVAGLPEPDLKAGLREAVEQQLLVVDGSGRGYGFRHELARAAIHDDLLPGERAQLHRAYAEAIESSAELVDDLDASSMLAHHWLAAHDNPRALSASVRAGRLAAAASAPSAAQRHFELALELWTEVPDAEARAERDHAGLLEMAADAAARAGGTERGLALVEQALTEVGETGDPERRATLLVRRGERLTDLGRDEEGLAVLEQAVELLPPDVPSRVSALALGSFARSLARTDRLKRAGELARRALAAAQAVGATNEQLEAQLTLAHAMVYAGDVDGGLALSRRTGEEGRAAQLPWIVGRAAIIVSDLELMLGRYDDVVRTVDEVRPLVKQSGFDRTVGAFVRANRAEALMRSGRWREAMRGAASEGEAPGVWGAALPVVRAELHALSGRRHEAELDLRETRRHLRRSSAAQFALAIAAIEAELARSAGELDGAAEIIRHALARADISEEHRYKWPLVSLGARIEADRALASPDPAASDGEGLGGRMGALLAEADGMAATTDPDRGHLALVRAEHARLRRDGETAAWAEAVHACRAMNEPHPLAYALLRQAESHAAAGDREAASASAREALELAHGMGAAPLVADIEALVRRARLSTEQDLDDAPVTAGAAPVDDFGRLGLTAREGEVLRLIADGCSNGQIAERLVISRKTASVHVSNILSKLGVATRLEAAAMAHRQGFGR